MRSKSGRSSLHAEVAWRRPSSRWRLRKSRATSRRGRRGAGSTNGAEAVPYETIETTPGRIIFNTALPDDFPFVNDVVGKRARSIGSIVEVLASNYHRVAVADSLDKIKELCSRYATQSGLTISMEDVRCRPAKRR